MSTNLEKHLAACKAHLVKRGNALGADASTGELKTQINGLIAAAAEETEPEVLVNLLRYQRAREENWASVAETLEADMKELVTKAGQLAAEQTAELAMHLIRHLLLYMNRAYTFERWKVKAPKKVART